ENSPFYVNKQRAEWEAGEQPRRAGVSSFGVGGTNAHVVIEQAPEQPSPPAARAVELLVLSAQSEAALERATDNLAEHLRNHPEANFEDIAWTLQAGRRAFAHRRAVVARGAKEAVAALSTRDRKQVQTRARPLVNPEVFFLLPGQGSQYPNMGRELFETEPVFREAVERCSEILRPEVGADLKDLLCPEGAVSHDACQRITETILAQPAIFTVEYALAQLWTSWGIHPKGMLGHSVGEFVAACLAGVFSLEDGLRLVAARGQMMQKLPAGGMLSVRLPENEIRSRINGHLSIAAINSPSLCVVSGPFEALEPFEAQLREQGVASRRLVTSHAFHSAMMDPIAQPFSQACARVKLNPPRIPYVSGVTGKWITSEQATDPAYWARHSREAVQFSAGVKLLRENQNAMLLEVGPGNVLTTLARQHAGFSAGQMIVPSLADGHSGADDSIALMNALGALWTAGTQPDWAALYHGVQRRRVSLPAYPFERKRYWIELPEKTQSPATGRTDEQSTVDAPSLTTTAPQETAEVNATVQGQGPSSTNRVAQIRKSLADIFEDLSGTDISNVDGATTFLEMGFDSLFLTQVTQALQSKLGLKITFRQLLGDQSSLNGLAEYVDQNVSAEKFAQPASDAPPTSPVSTASVDVLSVAAPPTAALAASGSAAAEGASLKAAASDGTIERVIREQMQAINALFAKQLDALRGISGQAQAATSALSIDATTSPAAAPPITGSVATTPAPADKDAKELKGYTPFKPLPKPSSAELTPQQREYIASLVERYTRRTAQSKQKTQEYRQVLADPRVVSGFHSEWKEMVYPIVAVRSKGSHLWDIDGNEYVDLLNGFGPIMLGHRPHFVEKAIEKQLHEGFEIGPQTLLAGEVARMICEFTGNERATFCNTGSEAVVAAMRVARTVTGRNKIVSFAGDYHGMFDEVLVKGIRKGGLPHAIPAAPGIPREKAANVVVLDYGSADSLEWIRANAGELAAVMVEPVQSRHPALQPVEFLRELRQITERSGACLIFDEVVTGFRVHPGGCQALFGIRADLATYGKVLAGGMPFGVLAGKARYMDALDGGTWQFGDDSYPAAGVTFFAGTFVRHPLTLAAAKAVLEHLKEQGPALQERLSKRTGELVQQLNEILCKYNLPAQIENFGSIFYFFFPNDFRFGSLFYYHLREKGIHLLEGFPCFLTTAHSEADLERVVRAFEESAAEMQAGGALPSDKGASRQTHATVPISEAEPVLSAPMTEPQLEIWLSDQLSEAASCSYNESFTLRMRGALNQSALQQAMQQVIARHDALRSSFDGETHTVRFAPELKIDIPVVDLAGLSQAERDARVLEIIQQDARTPFRLAEAPLVRAQIVVLDREHTLLLVTSHHIVCDGWSTNVLLDELSTIYNAIVRGEACGLPRAMSFAEYATMQAALAESDEAKDTENFWIERFQQLPPFLDLPADRPRPAVKEFKGATYRYRIGSNVYSDVKKLGARQKCTLFVTLLSALQILLSRLSGQDDIVVGIPTAGQSLVEDVLVGHCVNFIPLRGRVVADLTVAEYLAQVKQCVLEGYEHQNYTYGRLVRKLALRRDPSRLPLTDVQFNLERVGEGLRFEGLETEVDPNPKAFVNFDLFMNIVESKDGLALDCDYNTSLFDEETIARWVRHYETLLQGMVANANDKVSELPLLSDAERRQLLVEWNATAAEYPSTECVHQLIDSQAARSPGRCAVIVGDRSLDYSHLVERANQLANYLVKLGVKPGHLIGVATERTADMIVALLAAWKAGAAYVPLDPAYPRERLAYIVDQTKIAALLTQAALLEQLPVTDAALVCLDKDQVLIERERTAAPQVCSDPNSLAYVIFTSGSTGKPKGVEVSHKSVVNLLWSMREKPGFAENDRLLAVTTLSFDIAALELFLPLVCGGSVILAGRETAADGGLLYKAIEQSRPTVMQGTPATWRLLLEAGWRGAAGMKILCGGEALSRDLADRLVACGEVWNMYGPTETTIWSAACRVEKANGPVPFGGPIANTQLYVLDARRNPAPIGVPGELYIGGAGLARGYFGRPELSEERFVPDPFARTVNQRMFKTGDLVRYRTDGRLEFLGRLDTQVKVRGFRIELEEIEAALSSHPAVRQCVVAAREGEPGLNRLIAYLVAGNGEKPSSADLREWVARSLPAYMLPSIFVFLDQLPKTPNGKVDRKALPACAAAMPAEPFVAPKSPTETELARICAEVLKAEKISIDRSLFDLGADSIHIFQIVARANRAGIAVSPQDVLTFQTIHALAAHLDQPGSGRADRDAPIPRVQREQYRLRETSPRA
ncbi:MAG TPA: amino acid adenylation domain-containing protein, partial [Candidatus Acidoferrales bacterium]|nr:amino acid adenylation domain-containing protein [Candidatus Acidoferrales bacterium]